MARTRGGHQWRRRLLAILPLLFTAAVDSTDLKPSKWIVKLRNDIIDRTTFTITGDIEYFEKTYPALKPRTMKEWTSEVFLQSSSQASWRSQCPCPQPWSSTSRSCRHRCRKVRRLRALHSAFSASLPPWSQPMDRVRPDHDIDLSRHRSLRLSILEVKESGDRRLIPQPARAMGSFDSADNLHGAVMLTYGETTDVS